MPIKHSSLEIGYSGGGGCASPILLWRRRENSAHLGELAAHTVFYVWKLHLEISAIVVNISPKLRDIHEKEASLFHMQVTSPRLDSINQIPGKQAMWYDKKNNGDL